MVWQNMNYDLEPLFHINYLFENSWSIAKRPLQLTLSIHNILHYLLLIFRTVAFSSFIYLSISIYIYLHRIHVSTYIFTYLTTHLSVLLGIGCKGTPWCLGLGQVQGIRERRRGRPGQRAIEKVCMVILFLDEKDLYIWPLLALTPPFFVMWSDPFSPL